MTSLILSALGLTVFAAASVTWFRHIQRVAIPDERRPFLVSWLLAVVLGLAGLVVPGGGWLSAALAVLAALGGSLMLALYALGTQRTGDAIAVGMSMPAFTAPDDRGVTFHSASLAGSLVLIKFFRGHW